MLNLNSSSSSPARAVEAVRLATAKAISEAVQATEPTDTLNVRRTPLLRRRVAECCDQLVAMPLRGRIGSLNVNAAAGALLYEVLHRRAALDSAP